jgi:hypothetical protein
MPVQFYPVSSLADHTYEGWGIAQPLVYQMMNAMAFAYVHVNVWGNYLAEGSCRAVALHYTYPEFLFGVSVFGVSHAEENLIPLINANGAAFTYMYVDIEPCYGGRYPGHGCRNLIATTFNAGTVFYGISQEDYAKGDVKRRRMSGPQEQADMNSSLTGHFPFPLIPLGKAK